MRKLLAAALVIITALSLFGCGSSNEKPKDNPAQAEPKDMLTIENSGWSATGQYSQYIHYGLEIQNNSTDEAAVFPVITATGKDADGKIIFTNDLTLQSMMPGVKYVVGNQVGDGKNVPATIDFSISVKDSNVHKLSASDLEAVKGEQYTISNLNIIDNNKLTGEVTINKVADIQNMVRIDAIFKNADGEIVSGYFAFVDDPVKGETKPFEVNLYDLPEYASYEVTGMPW